MRMALAKNRQRTKLLSPPCDWLDILSDQVCIEILYNLLSIQTKDRHPSMSH